MAQIGAFVTDPKLGAYCRVKLDDGKLLLSHDRASLDTGVLTISEVRWLGLGAGETILTCDLARPEGRAVRDLLTRGAAPGSPAATPLGAVVELLKECRTMADVRARCEELLRQSRPAEAHPAS